MFDWINPLYAYIGVGGVAVAACAVVAWYFPPLRKPAIAIGAGILAVLAIYRKGSKDASDRAARQRAEEERRAIERGHKARTDAERDVSSGRVRDRWDRDE